MHNPVVQQHLRTLGVQRAISRPLAAAPRDRVIITAHGAADRDRAAWRDAGYAVTDTTCPLVRKAHSALALLVAQGCQPIVIGQAGHVEVRGLCGDFPGASVVQDEADVAVAAFRPERFGVVSQTTQPLAKVLRSCATAQTAPSRSARSSSKTPSANPPKTARPPWNGFAGKTI